LTLMKQWEDQRVIDFAFFRLLLTTLRWHAHRNAESGFKHTGEKREEIFHNCFRGNQNGLGGIRFDLQNKNTKYVRKIFWRISLWKRRLHLCRMCRGRGWRYRFWWGSSLLEREGCDEIAKDESTEWWEIFHHQITKGRESSWITNWLCLKCISMAKLCRSLPWFQVESEKFLLHSETTFRIYIMSSNKV
jgi:hypothetical protein